MENQYLDPDVTLHSTKPFVIPSHVQRKTATGRVVKHTLERYRSKKYAYGFIQIAMAVIFVTMGILLACAAIEEAKTGKVPSVFENKSNTMIAMIVFAVTTMCLWFGMMITGYQFARDGEGQLDSLLSHTLSMLAIWVIGVALMASYATTNMTDKKTLKRIRYHIYIFGTVQCVCVLIMFVRSITRLTSTDHTPVDYQQWQQNARHRESDKKTFFANHVIRASAGKWVYTLIVLIFSVPALTLGSWMCHKNLKEKGLLFNEVFKTYTITMAIVTLILFMAYMYWNINIFYMDYSEIYRIHFNHYFVSNSFPVILIILCFLSYHHNYTQVQAFHGITPHEFENIKTTHMSNIINLFLCFLPFMASGIGRAICLFINMDIMYSGRDTTKYEKQEKVIDLEDS